MTEQHDAAHVAEELSGALDPGDRIRPVDTVAPREVLSNERVFTGRVWDVEQERVSLGEAGEVTRDFVLHTGAVVVIAYDAGRVFLVKQYRHPVRTECWEPVAGLLDEADEHPLDAAKRELLEEADLTARTWHTLVDYFPSAGGSSEGIRVYLARDVAEVPAHLRHQRTEEEAQMSGHWVGLDDVLDAILAGQVHSSSLLVGAMALDRAEQDGFAALRPADAPWERPPSRAL